MTDTGVTRVRPAVALLAAALLLPSETRGQEALLPLRTDTVAYTALEISKPALVWMEFTIPRGVVKPWMTVARALRDGSRDSSAAGTVVPANGLFLPAGRYFTSLYERVSGRPDTVWYRIRAVAIESPPPAGADSSPVSLDLDTPVAWRGPERTFAIQLPAAGTVAVLGSAGGLEIVWRDSAGTELGNHPDIQVVGPAPVLASVRWDGGGSPNPAIAFRFFDLSDDLEPNDLPDLATPVDVDQWYAVSVGQTGDLDYVEVTVSRPGVLAVQASGQSESVTGVLLLKGGSQVPLPARVAPGTHVLLLDLGSAFRSPDPLLVRLTLRSSSGPADPEPSAALEWGKPHRLRLGSANRTDSVLVSVKKAGIVEWVTSSGDPGDRPILTLVRGDSVVSPAAPIGQARLRAGDYVARVSGSKTPGLETGVLWMFWSPESDPQEPNDDSTLATPLRFPSVQPIRIHPSGDVDWFRFEVKDAGILRLTQAKGSMFFRRELRFQVSRTDTAKVLDRSRSTDSLDIHFLLSPGVHLLRVESSIPSSAPALVSMVFEPGRGGVATAGDLAIGLIGLGLGKESSDWIRASAEGSGTMFFAAEDKESFETALDSTLETLVSAVRPGLSPWAVFVALALLTLVFFVGYRRMQSKTGQPDS